MLNVDTHYVLQLRGAVLSEQSILKERVRTLEESWTLGSMRIGQELATLKEEVCVHVSPCGVTILLTITLGLLAFKRYWISCTGTATLRSSAIGGQYGPDFFHLLALHITHVAPIDRY
jgi:hypothetical protein